MIGHRGMIAATSMCAAAIAMAVTAASPGAADEGMACADLAGLALPDVTVTLAEAVAAGAFPPPRERDAQNFARLPAFCRVAATSTPRPDSEINFEVWLPADGWNGGFVGAGNGGFAGSILHQNMASPLQRGYAVANTDTGHQGRGWDDATFGADPEKIIDFGHRAVHLMTVASKAIVEAHYGQPLRASLWAGCSTGGRQGLAAAQHYPEDFDAIAVGAPANNMASLQAHAVLVQTMLNGQLARQKLGALREAAIAACDADDGLTDRIISRPEQCDFDPADAQCTGRGGRDCLAASEVEAARRIYAGLVSPSTGEQLYAPPQPGSERGWNAFGGDETIGSNFYRDMVFQDPRWDFRSLDVDTDVARAEQIAGGVMETDDPDISAFLERGGKLLLWHGWTDGLVLPGNTIDYYHSVVETLGAEATDQSVRLFMLPSVDHCTGGEGPSWVDHIAAVEQWRDSGVAPERLIARGNRQGVQITRPVCAYPQVAIYDGAGDPNEADSFTCGAAP